MSKVDERAMEIYLKDGGSLADAYKKANIEGHMIANGFTQEMIDLFNTVRRG